MDLSLMREEFMRAGLHRKDLHTDPVKQFERWFEDAREAGYRMPNAMTLATVGSYGQPSMRLVLLKFFDSRGFVFYTNYNSRKAREIGENARVALHFPWHDLDRQIHITGVAEKVTNAESVKYFLTRPRGSQIGAWVSNQSHVISSRQMLQSKYEELKRKFENKEVPLPSFWGGFRVVPETFEFWQGQESRLHDRFLYQLDENRNWKVDRLAP
jgi:pyridoxamine 5'-phosphate oxidase